MCTRCAAMAPWRMWIELLQRDAQHEIAAGHEAFLSAGLPADVDVDGLEPAVLVEHLLDHGALAGRHLVDRAARPLPELHRFLGFPGRPGEEEIDADLDANGLLATFRARIGVCGICSLCACAQWAKRQCCREKSSETLLCPAHADVFRWACMHPDVATLIRRKARPDEGSSIRTTTRFRSTGLAKLNADPQNERIFRRRMGI